jgi:predicted small metal-binding protein
MFPMMSLTCKDIGIECTHELNGSDEREIMKQFIDHAESEHKMSVLSADVIYRVQKAIKK